MHATVGNMEKRERVAWQLRELLRRHLMSPEDVEAVTGKTGPAVSAVTVRRILAASAKTEPQPRTLRRICDATGEKYTDAFSEDGSTVLTRARVKGATITVTVDGDPPAEVVDGLRDLFQQHRAPIEYVTLPIFRTAAGFGRDATTQTGETIDLPSDCCAKAKGRPCYALRVEGDSMDGPPDNLKDGDVVIVAETRHYSLKAVVVVYVKSQDETTLKRVQRRKETMILKPSNPRWPILHCPAEDVEIQGEVIEVIHRHS